MTKKMTQKLKLLRRLSTGKNLTTVEAENRLGVQSLSARIFELRRDGFPIYTNRVRVRSGRFAGSVVTAYTLNVHAMPKKLLNRMFVA